MLVGKVDLQWEVLRLGNDCLGRALTAAAAAMFATGFCGLSFSCPVARLHPAFLQHCHPNPHAQAPLIAYLHALQTAGDAAEDAAGTRKKLQ